MFKRPKDKWASRELTWVAVGVIAVVVLALIGLAAIGWRIVS